MATTSLQRFGVTKYCAMCVAKTTPKGWSKPTLLLRFCEQSGANIAFVVTGDALEVMTPCELWRIYDIDVPGKCVKMRGGASKYGVANPLEVHLMFPPKVAVSKSAWQLQFPYDFTEWEALNQAIDGSFVDVCGMVCGVPEFTSDGLDKLQVILSNGEASQKVSFLGTHAGLQLHKGDVVAVGGARVVTWKHDRFLQSAHLSVVEVNPVSRKEIPSFEGLDAAEPKRKAMRMSSEVPLTLSTVQGVLAQLRADSEKGTEVKAKDFLTKGKLEFFGPSFFESDPPLFTKGDKEQVCWSTFAVDNSARLAVKVWDGAFRVVCGITASKLREMWESGLQFAEQRKAVLDALNAHSKHEFLLSCSASVWVSGGKEKSHTPQINVNAVEIIDHDDA